MSRTDPPIPQFILDGMRHAEPHTDCRWCGKQQTSYGVLIAHKNTWEGAVCPGPAMANLKRALGPLPGGGEE